jgi:hypothetical protein
MSFVLITLSGVKGKVETFFVFVNLDVWYFDVDKLVLKKVFVQAVMPSGMEIKARSASYS